MKNTEIGLSTAEILLPRPHVAYDRWAVVACDQFTSDPEYWAEVEHLVGDAPSALKIVLPEIYLQQRTQRTREIQAWMRTYIGNALEVKVPCGFVALERQTLSGIRPGLIACVDLEKYDFSQGSDSLIRATEGTVPERVPPRAEIRAGAILECPHVMMLIDDPEKTVIEPLLESPGRPLYDFDLMQGGGHIRGWAVENGQALQVFEALNALYQKSDGLLYAVGDGNHSLAAAKACWEDIRKNLSPAQMEEHPARYAMVELVNLHCPALQFEPIHRVLFHVDPEQVLREWAEDSGFGEGKDVAIALAGRKLYFGAKGHPIHPLQAFLDRFLQRHPEAEIEYIHDDDQLLRLAQREDAVGFMPRAFDKSELFPSIRQNGALPRKTFSMGTARDKRYYLESRRIGQ